MSQGSVAIISMGQARQVQTQQGIPLSITAKLVTILDFTIQDRVTSMKVALFFLTVNESKQWDYTELEFLFALTEIHEYRFV